MGSGEHGPHVIPWQLGSETSAKMEEMAKKKSAKIQRKAVFGMKIYENVVNL